MTVKATVVEEDGEIGLRVFIPLKLPKEIEISPCEALTLRREAQHFTMMEQKVMARLRKGLGNKEIAWELHVSVRTVKFHVSNILAKLGFQSRAELLFREETAEDTNGA